MMFAVKNALYESWSNSSDEAHAERGSGRGEDTLFDQPDDRMPRQPAAKPWHILIVDDDPGVHQATLFALNRVRILDRPLAFHHAHSAAEALDMMRRHADMAVVLLDVVMEHEAAGLAAIGAIRGELGNHGTRIILRTGQPGYAPESDTVLRYDINGYATKGELTRNRLLTAITAAIRAYDQIRRLEESQQSLREVVGASQRLMAEAGWPRFAATLLDEIARLLGVESNGVVCASKEGVASIVAASGRYAGYLGQPMLRLPAELGEPIQSCLLTRSRFQHSGRLFLYFRHHDGGEFVAALATAGLRVRLDEGLLDMFGLTVAACSDNVRLLEQVQHIAYNDPLLDLPNRNAFVQAIDERLRERMASGFRVALLDVDAFAEANAMFGHAYGNALLREVAQRLQRTLGECLVARIANDTFGVLVPPGGLHTDELQQLLRSDYLIDGISHPVSLSAGLVELSGTEADGDGLLQDAYLALKLAKQRGHGQSAYFTPEIGSETRARTQMLHALQAALGTEQFFLCYQPQIDLSDGRVVGVEALLRWRTPDGTMIGPDHFIPVAEYSGLIVDLGAWVLRQALGDLKQLHAAGHSSLRMAVNVSMRQIERPSFLTHLEEALESNAIAPESLEVEVTESMATDDPGILDDTLASLRMRGVSVALDDFGTGYSSLAYLDRLPADRLKIDRAFVSALTTQAPGVRIAEMVIPLGQQLNMRVLAEGVETQGQIDSLRALGCHEAQGYFFARPMPLPDLMAWLSSDKS